jgi:hypothetical protein
VIQTEWADFTLEDLTDDEVYHMTKEKMEEAYGKFEAVELQDGKPLHIWFKDYVVKVLRFSFLFTETPMVAIPRNPNYTTGEA